MKKISGAAKIKIEQYRYVKEIISDSVINIPEAPFAWQSYNYRKLILVVPKFTTWLINDGKEKEDLYELDIILVDCSNNTIHHETLSLRKASIEDALMFNGNIPKNPFLYEVVNYIKSYMGDSMVTIDSFKEYYNKVL